ncbi:uncharacterized protein LOC143368759 [Andrena cerasifolii]|uniref:uncharacterized protein LOC143368759 n=1 Tax=Andrena cerasifolii TaxID=2819439 RepID=UPI0040384A7B
MSGVMVGNQMGGGEGDVFRQCNVYQTLENGILPKDHFLVGDNAFPLKEYLLKPFPGTRLTLKQTIFNYRLSSARRVVVNAFGIMANKFRIFEKPIAFSSEKMEQSTDITNLDNGSIIEGSWRSAQQPLGLLPLSRTLSNHPNRRSQDLRERLADYFVGEGSVPWQ